MELTLFFFLCFYAVGISAQKSDGIPQTGNNLNPEKIEQLRPGFLNPASEYRAFPMGFTKPEESISEYANRLVAGKWGGAHLGHRSKGKGYLRDEKGWNDGIIFPFWIEPLK